MYMMMGQLGPKTLPKCMIRGIKLERNFDSMITAAWLLIVPLKSAEGAVSPVGFDVHLSLLLSTAFGLRSVSGASIVVDGCDAEYMEMIVVWG